MNSPLNIVNDLLKFYVLHSASGMDALKIEEMEKMLKEAQLEKARLIESRVSQRISIQSIQ